MNAPAPDVTDSPGPLALEGIRVLDLSRVLAGPFCGALLGDMGADVIKVEETSRGDEARTWQPQKNGESAAFVVNNRNKRGIAVDLKTPEGVAVLKRLVADADVLIENFRTGTMEEFGLGYDVLNGLNPRLVYCSITAFGRTGPRAKDGGYEALMQAYSGIMSITGEADGPPVRSGVSFIDLATGTLCAFGIVNALLARQRMGRGQRVDGALLDTAIGILNYQAESYLMVGDVPKAMGSAHPAIAPYRNYRCADGHWVFVAGANDNLTRKLMSALGLGAVCDDPKFATNAARVAHRQEIDAIVSAAIARYDRKALLQLFEDAQFPASPVNSVADSLEDPQVLARGMRWEMDHPVVGKVPVVRLPLTFSGMTPSLRRSSPRHGEHTDEVLAESGMTIAEITSLRASAAVK